MTDTRPGTLGEIAVEAGQERASFLNDAASQLRRFLESNRERIAEVGGMVLLDEDPDYLSIAQDLTFRSRTRVQDATTGEWQSETEIIESPSEICELYNPSDLRRFAEAAREQGGLPTSPRAPRNCSTKGYLVPRRRWAWGIGGAIRTRCRDEWRPARRTRSPPRHRGRTPVNDLALTFRRAAAVRGATGGAVRDRGDNRTRVRGRPVSSTRGRSVWFKSLGSFEAEVNPSRRGEESDGAWKPLASPETWSIIRSHRPVRPPRRRAGIADPARRPRLRLGEVEAEDDAGLTLRRPSPQAHRDDEPAP